MSGTFTAQVKGWTRKAKRNADLVVKGSISDVGELMTRRAEGTSAGGEHRVGFVPVVTGELINSHEIGINGGVVSEGPADYTAALAGMELGDTVSGVFTADHARPKEYGHGSAPGWFYVRNAVQQWEVIVGQNAAQFKE